MVRTFGAFEPVEGVVSCSYSKLDPATFKLCGIGEEFFRCAALKIDIDFLSGTL